MVDKVQVFTPQDCRLIVKKYLQSNEFEVLQSEEEPISTSYSSLKIKISIENVKRELRFVAKHLHQGSKEIFCHESLFKNFKDAYPTFSMDFTPKYYFAKNDSWMVFEDFFEQGFVISNNFDIDHIKLALMTLAKFHVGSIWFEETQTRKLLPIFHNGCEISSLVDKIPIQEQFQKILKKMVENSLKTESKFKSVLCHGSLRSPNILFKYEDKIPVQCKLINFELQQYKPPAYDVLHLIYMATNQQNRKHHLYELLQFYYACLQRELSIGNLDDSILPIEDFEASIHHLLPITKIQAPNCILEIQHLITHPRLTIEDCFKIIQNKIGTTNYELLDYKITPLDKMCGYLGDHNKLKIDIVTNGQRMTLNLFAKFMPKAPAAIDIAMDIGAFDKEIFVYQKYIPMAQKYGISIIDECAVPCYFARRDDVLIFEDFNCRNYKILDSKLPLTYETVVVVIKKLAKFHACSIILEEKLSEETKSIYRFNVNYVKELKEGLFGNSNKHKGAKCTKVGIDAIERELELFPQFNTDEMKMKIKKAYQRTYELIKPSEEFRNVICHGDLWINNFLIHSIDGISTDCRFIDYQLCRYCPPTQDLLTFIYLGTNRKFRSQHLDELIQLYYGEFSKCLFQHQCDVEQIYSYDNFMKSVEYMMPQAICQTVIYFQLCLINQDVSNEYLGTEELVKKTLLENRRDFVTALFEREPIFKERACESLQDLKEMCAKYF